MKTSFVVWAVQSVNVVALSLMFATVASARVEPTTANERVVAAFIDAMDRMMAARAAQDVPGIIEKYWTADCVQHRAGVAPGRAGLIASVSKLPPETPGAAKLPPIKTLSLSTEEDRVIMIRRRVQPDPDVPGRTIESYVFNIYRLEGGKIAENWWAVSAR